MSDYSNWHIVSNNPATTPSTADYSGWEVVDSDKEAKKAQFENLTGMNRTPVGNIRDIIGGAVNTLGNTGQMIASGLTGGYAPQGDVAGLVKGIQQKKPNPLATGLGEALPFGVLGGANLLRQALAAGATGFVNAKPDQTNLFGLLPNGRVVSGIENALLTYGGGKLLGNIFKTPSTFNEDYQSLSPKIASDIHNSVIGNRSFEDSGKELASELHSNYKNIVGDLSNKYKTMFNKPTDNINYFTDEPIKVRDVRMDDSTFKDDYGDYDFPDKNLQKLHAKFTNNPTVQNAHNFQKELGSEIGYMQKQQSNGLLDSTGKNRLSDYVNMRNQLKGDMSNIIGPEFDDLTSQWEQNVIPYHADKDLKQIAEGKIINPTKSQITSIFQFPESNISKVANDLSQNGKNRIVHIGMGKNPYQNTPKDIVSGFNSIHTKGLNSYVNPELDQNVSALRSSLESDKAAKEQAKANEVAKNALLEAEQAKFSTKAKNALKTIAAGAIGAGIGHVIDSSPELAGAYYGSKRLFKKLGKH